MSESLNAISNNGGNNNTQWDFSDIPSFDDMLKAFRERKAAKKAAAEKPAAEAVTEKAAAKVATEAVTEKPAGEFKSFGEPEEVKPVSAAAEKGAEEEVPAVVESKNGEYTIVPDSNIDMDGDWEYEEYNTDASPADNAAAEVFVPLAEIEPKKAEPAAEAEKVAPAAAEMKTEKTEATVEQEPKANEFRYAYGPEEFAKRLQMLKNSKKKAEAAVEKAEDKFNKLDTTKPGEKSEFYTAEEYQNRKEFYNDEIQRREKENKDLHESFGSYVLTQAETILKKGGSTLKNALKGFAYTALAKRAGKKNIASLTVEEAKNGITLEQKQQEAIAKYDALLGKAKDAKKANSGENSLKAQLGVNRNERAGKKLERAIIQQEIAEYKKQLEKLEERKVSYEKETKALESQAKEYNKKVEKIQQTINYNRSNIEEYDKEIDSIYSRMTRDARINEGLGELNGVSLNDAYANTLLEYTKLYNLIEEHKKNLNPDAVEQKRINELTAKALEYQKKMSKLMKLKEDLQNRSNEEKLIAKAKVEAKAGAKGAKEKGASLKEAMKEKLNTEKAKASAPVVSARVNVAV